MLTEFSKQKIAEHGALELSESIASGRRLSLQEIEFLEELSLPILGKLIQIQSLSRGEVKSDHHPKVMLRPLVCLPLAEWLDVDGVPSALAKAEALLHGEELRQILQDHDCTLSLTLDRWHGKFDFTVINSLLLKLQSSFDSSFALLGPSAREIKEIAQAHQRNPENTEDMKMFLSESILPTLRMLGIDTICGGTSLRIHKLCADLGFRNFISLDLNKYRLENTDSRDASFAKQLFEIRETLPEKNAGWLPLFRTVLDKIIPGVSSKDRTQPLGLEVLKAVAIARLVLPDYKSIQAPLAMFSHKAADIAVRFGANDFGFVAATADTAKELELPLLRESLELFETSPVEIILREETV